MASPAYNSRLKRRRLLFAGLAFLCLVLAGGTLIDSLGGAFRRRPYEIERGLSPAARRLLERAFEGLERRELFDYHTHVVGLGAGGTGNFVNPRMLSYARPLSRLRFAIYASASGVRDLGQGDVQFRERLESLTGRVSERGRFLVLAFDYHYDRRGRINLEHSEFHVPNEYVWRLARENPSYVPAISVHPYRADALERLEYWADRGVKFVKWLPNAMGMDPADARVIPFYNKMIELDMVLLSHAGREAAVEGEEYQDLGNPLRFRLPLDRGLRVIMSHCASLGDYEDLDHPGRRRSSFDLFLRLLEDEKYDPLLFGEISAMTQYNRVDPALVYLLRHPELHDRLLNGSDYPLPAINFLIQTGSLQRAGLLSPEDRAALNEIYDYNPLLFDFALKRSIHAPGDPSARLSDRIFLRHPDL